ncbi:MAG: STAS domain-containing protein [Oscillospiraceae bacterium]|nr:STAS domain-containing protein [Oscillospiraceae bacterium]
MELTCRSRSCKTRWKLTGEIDHHRAQALSRELEREVSTRLPGELVLDFSGVTFMDSSGIALVLRASRLMEELGGRLRLESVPGQALRVLKAAGIHRRVELGEE